MPAPEPWWLTGPEDAPSPSADVRAFGNSFRRGVADVLGDNLVSLYLFGAIAFPRPTSWLLDVDFHCLLATAPSEEECEAVRNLHRRLAEMWSLGSKLDGHYLLEVDASQAGWPQCRVFSNTDHAWALHRAHVHGARFFQLAGEDPRFLLSEPAWEELDDSLDAEMRYIIEHPEHPAFGVLNACRVLYSTRTRDVVVSKYAAAQWGQQELPEWAAVLESAVRLYSRVGGEDDLEAVRGRGREFISMVCAETEMPR
ncbi:MAG: aminoglycoside adenylyltransferase domain-containing protein [Acidimicrobiia bacterium]